MIDVKFTIVIDNKIRLMRCNDEMYVIKEMTTKKRSSACTPVIRVPSNELKQNKFRMTPKCIARWRELVLSSQSASRWTSCVKMCLRRNGGDIRCLQIQKQCPMW